MTDPTSNLVERVNRMEREVKRWRVGVAATCLIALSALLMGQAAPQKRSIEAHSFVLKSDNGQDQMRIFSTPDGPSVVFFDGRDMPQLSLSFLNGETSISLFRAGHAGLGHLASYQDKAGKPVLDLFNPRGSYVGRIAGAAEGVGLVFTDKSDHKRLEVSFSEQDSNVTVFDAEGRPFWSAGAKSPEDASQH